MSVVSSVGDLRYAIYEPTEGNTPNGIRTRVNLKSEIANLASAGRPGHFAAAENVKVQVRDGFAGVGPVIEDEAESVFEAELFGDFTGFEEQMSKDGVVTYFGFSDARDGFFGNDEDMHRRLGFDIVESDHPVVFVNDGGRDFARDDFFKQRFAHVQNGGPNEWRFRPGIARSILGRNSKRVNTNPQVTQAMERLSSDSLTPKKSLRPHAY